MARASLLSAVLPVLLLGAAAGCADWRYGFYSGPDCPDDIPGARMPPTFEPCRHPKSIVQADTDRDGRPDTFVIVSDDAHTVCRATDTNGDGMVDSWDMVRDGKLVVKATDTNADGKTDQLTTWPQPWQPGCPVVEQDQDGDGKADPGAPRVDRCAAALRPAGLAIPASPGNTPPAAPGPLLPLASPLAPMP